MTSIRLTSVTEPDKSIQMGDDITMVIDSVTTLTGVIRQYDYDNGNVLLEDTGTDFLHVIKNYQHFYKDLSPP